MFDCQKVIGTRDHGDYPPVIKHGVLENGPLISAFPIKTSIHRGFSIAVFDYQRVASGSIDTFFGTNPNGVFHQ